MSEDLTKRVETLEQRADNIDKKFDRVFKKIERIEKNLNNKMDKLLSKFNEFLGKLTFLDKLTDSQGRINTLEHLYSSVNSQLENCRIDYLNLGNRIKDLEEKAAEQVIKKAQKACIVG